MRSTMYLCRIAIGVAMALSGRTMAADLPLTSSDPIARAMDRITGGVPSADQSVAAARRRLDSSIHQLERFLAGGGNQVAGQWRDWLRLPALQDELARGQPDVAALQSLLDRYYRNEKGLEQPAFLAVRRELRSYLAAREYAAAASPDDLLRQRLAELEACLARLSEVPAQPDAHRAGSIVAWLESLCDEGAALARAVRERYGAPNARGQVSGRLANVLLARDVAERSFIRDFVLGSNTSGMVYTRGRVTFGVVPSTEFGTLEVRLQGLASAPAHVAERDRVSIYSSALTSISARKQVSINDQGLRLSPAVASSSTTVRIRDIDARSRFVERIAWRRASQMLPEAESAASQRASSEASSKLDQQAGASLGGVNNIFCDKIRAPLIRFDALPPSFRFWSDDRHLRLLLSQRNDTQLAAAGPAPSFPASYDLAGCVHESMINNLCETLLGGRTIDDEAWLGVAHLLFGTPPRPLWVHDRTERWSVTFARQQPMVAHFEGDRLGFTLRLAKVTRGTQELECPSEIAVKFIPQVSPESPSLLRDGDLEVRVADCEGEQATSLRRFLTRKFGAVFPTDFHFHGITPPAGGEISKLRLLKLAEFKSTGGWLSIGYELAPQAQILAAR